MGPADWEFRVEDLGVEGFRGLFRVELGPFGFRVEFGSGDLGV